MLLLPIGSVFLLWDWSIDKPANRQQVYARERLFSPSEYQSLFKQLIKQQLWRQQMGWQPGRRRHRWTRTGDAYLPSILGNGRHTGEIDPSHIFSRSNLSFCKDEMSRFPLQVPIILYVSIVLFNDGFRVKAVDSKFKRLVNSESKPILNGLSEKGKKSKSPIR